MLTIMSVVLTATMMAQSPVIVETSRSVFTHEVLDVKFEQNGISIKGWGLLQDKQNFIDSKSHDYTLVFNSSDDSFEIKASVWDANFTDLMAYRGKPRCDLVTTNTNECNYTYENVGFDALVPYTKMKSDQNYTVSLRMNAKSVGKVYQSPIHFYANSNLTTSIGRTKYFLKTSVEHASFRVFEEDVVVRAEPYKDANTKSIEYEKCSSAHGKVGYFLKNSIYSNIRRVIQNGYVKSYELNVKLQGCDGNRNRVVEGKDKVGFMQSTFIDYESDPLVIYVSTILSDPKLEAKNQRIEQYSTYDPRSDVMAFDEYGNDDSKSVSVYLNRVNTRVPGVYEVEYRYRNLKKIINVEVIPIPVMYRYVDELTQNQLSLWNRTEFQTVLKDIIKNGVTDVTPY